MASFTLNWKGDVVVKIAEAALTEIVADLGEIAEAESKRELNPGHGLLSGDLRRSIHVAEPGHVYAGEDGKSERGGKRVLPVRAGARFALSLGSGLKYAMAIHQGWPLGYPGLRGQFAGYHYLSKGVDRARPQLKVVVQRHRLK
jgi:hypothetical protein